MTLSPVSAQSVLRESARLDEAAESAPWAAETWTTANGLPQNSVTGIAQDQTGMLWLTTFGGLVRFDGVRMTVHSVADTPQLATNRLLSVLAVGDAMWVGTEGHGLQRIRGTAIEAIGGAPGATSLTIPRLAVDSEGVIWAATQRGLARVEHGVLTLPMPEADVVANDVACGHDGSVYLGSTSGLYRYRRDGVRAWPGLHILSLSVGPDGTVFAAGDTGLCRVTEHGVEPCPGRWNMVPDMAVTRGDDLLVLERARVRHLDPETLADQEDPVDVGPSARCIWQDADGSLWVGCDGAGLTCLRRADLRRRGLGHATLLAAKADGGFYHSVSGTLFRTDAAGQRREIYRTPVDIYALAAAADGGAFFATGGDIRRVAPDGSVTLRWRGSAADRARLTALAVAGDDLWIGSDNGMVMRLRADDMAVLRTESEEHGAIHCFVAVGASMWIGSARGVLRTDDDGRTWRQLRAGVDVAAGEVRGIAADGQGAIWIGSYGGGLTRCRGDTLQVLGVRGGLPTGAICQLEVDRDRDELLLNTNVGLCRIPLADMRAFADGRAPATTCVLPVPPPSASVEGNGFKWPSSCRLDTGAWLFCSLDDVVELPPAAPDQTPKPLVTIIDVAVVGDDGAAASRHFRATFTAPTFANARFVMFRHRLVGFDADWVQTGHERSVDYLDLPAGDYLFEVCAIGPGRTWGPAAGRRVTISAAWFERGSTWFFGAMLLGVAMLGIARFTSRHQSRRNQLLAAAVAARTNELEKEVDRRRAAEDQLRSAHDDLEERVRMRTRELEQAAAQLATDARQREALQRQVDQLQRLDSIGRLAGGIAHDFNNLLTVVLSSAELLRSTPADDPVAADLLESIQRAAHQGSRLTQQLLTFARRMPLRKEVLDLRELVRNSAALLRRLLPAGIGFDLRLPAEPVVVAADPAQLEQVLVNLCVNARDAMRDGGMLLIELERVRRSDATDRCRLRVVDTGVGMTPEVLQRACEPFFSTKQRVTNSGLGLATCYGIVKRLEGELLIDSTPGQGTAVTIELACTDQPLPPPLPQVAIPQAPRLDGLALLIEDDEDVRAALQHLLASQGCQVRVAADGAEALDILAGGANPDFVLSDLLMPGLQGMDLVRALQLRRPGLPIVFVSGNPEEGGKELLRAGIEVLQKPPEVATLIAAIGRTRRAAASDAQASDVQLSDAQPSERDGRE